MSNDFRDDPHDLDAALDGVLGGVLDEDTADLDAELAETEQIVREQLAGGLAELLSAPADLASRTAAGVGDALLTRSTLAAAVDLLAVGWHTVRYLAGDPNPTSSKELGS
jgi:hypothetical protein